MQPAATPPAATPSELVVHSDTAMLRGRFRAIVLLHGGLVLAFLVVTGLLAMSDSKVLRSFAFVWLILVAGEILQLAIQCYSWGGRLAISRPATLDGWGLELQGQQGTIRVPWAAVPEVRQRKVFGQQILTFMLDPRAVPGQNGVEADPSSWPRYQKKGLMLGSVGLTPGFETIVPAIQHYSQGSTRIV